MRKSSDLDLVFKFCSFKCDGRIYETEYDTRIFVISKSSQWKEKCSIKSSALFYLQTNQVFCKVIGKKRNKCFWKTLKKELQMEIELLFNV